MILQKHSIKRAFYRPKRKNHEQFSLGLNGLGLCATQYASAWMIDLHIVTRRNHAVSIKVSIIPIKISSQKTYYFISFSSISRLFTNLCTGFICYLTLPECEKHFKKVLFSTTSFSQTTHNCLLFQSESYNNKSPLFHHHI